MTTTTPNLGLIKPERSDNYSVDVMSENMDIIDGKIAKLEAGEFETVNCAGTITADVGNFEKLTNLYNLLYKIKFPQTIKLIKLQKFLTS